ncbi:hypothetical protein [Streptomyces sp. MZ04]|nr:hypothetical protein [Streptomyces sp. MZ04]
MADLEGVVPVDARHVLRGEERVAHPHREDAEDLLLGGEVDVEARP